MNSYNKQDPQTIQTMFDQIAKNYDRTNAVLSFQLHRLWNRTLVKQAVATHLPKTYLDLCCGTGEIAFTYLKMAHQSCHAYLLDFSQQMLECAQAKEKKLNLQKTHAVSYVQADAQQIPLPDQSIDCVTIAYGIRNVKEPAQCLKEAFRVLKPGGTIGILELTQPSNPILRHSHKLYLQLIVPTVGRLLTSDQGAYRYLCNSIQSFVKPKELFETLNALGFETIKKKPLTFGIATLLQAHKPKK